MKLLYFNDFRLGVLKGDNVVDVTAVVEEIPHTGPGDLMNGLIEKFDSYRKKIEDARGFIQRSAGTMKALLLDPLENLARLEDFPMIERPQVCKRCNFRRLCFPRAVPDQLRVESQPASQPG